MKNKENLKKHLFLTVIVFMIFFAIFITFNIIQYNSFNRNNNIAINQIINNIKHNYPEVDINEIIEILSSENINQEDLLKQYGIYINKDASILANQNDYNKFLILNIIILFIFILTIIFIFVKYNKSQNKKIGEITKYIEEINKENYALDIQENTEDELSILKNELYKITVMLKEQSENSTNDKIMLKKSLEDISHQLKTPLTSITIMLDNLLDNPDMDQNTRNDFIKSIYREISNINFFIQALLKLSKLDSNTIKFNSKEENMRDIIERAKQNVLMLCDLKNIEIEIHKNDVKHGKENETDNLKIINEKINYDNDFNNTDKVKIIHIDNIREPKVFCDLKWQVEAITNILKNCVEHSNNNTKINISYSENSMYSEIIIKDNGVGIDKEDLKHIFERFYKGKNSSKDSIGIGLSLAKQIIEKDNGYITVESEINKGTKFSIRYLK